METYIICFTIDCSSKLDETYNKIKSAIKNMGDHYLEFSRGTWFLRTTLGKRSVRDKILSCLERDEGKILVMEIGLVGWAVHIHDDGRDNALGNWLKKYVSGDD